MATSRRPAPPRNSRAFPAVILPGLDRTRRALARLGHPEESFAAVLIAGTNGKGSVSAFMESVLRRAGYRTGHFTSPHLVDPRERIRVNGVPIGRRDWADLHRRLASLRLGLTEFEAHTLAAFQYFADHRIDIAVVEVGLGGRLDATNTLPAPEATVIASIGLDHTAWLGGTLARIYREKRGITRAGTPLIQNIPRELVGLSASDDRRDGVPSRRLGREIHVVCRSSRADGQTVDVRWPEGRCEGLRIPLLGRHQADNAALAVAALDALRRRGWRLSDADLRAGLASARWPGRFDVVSRRPMVVLDGAHNPPAAAALARAWRAVFGRVRPTMIFACLEDKDIDGIVRPLRSLAARWIATTVSGDRARSAAATAAALRRIVPSSRAVEAAPNFRAAWRRARSTGPVLVTGSLYLVGDAMRSFRRTP